jgi:hypothetical protein
MIILAKRKKESLDLFQINIGILTTACEGT